MHYSATQLPTITSPTASSSASPFKLPRDKFLQLSPGAGGIFLTLTRTGLSQLHKEQKRKKSSTVQAKAQCAKDFKGPGIKEHGDARDLKVGCKTQFLKKQCWKWWGGSVGGGMCFPGLDLLDPHGRENSLL